MKSHPFADSDDSDENVDRSSPRSASQRFTKSGARDFKATPARKKHDVESNLKLNLNRMHEDEGDSLEDSDDDTTTKTARSTSSGTTSQLTPKPRERSFMKQDQTRPTTKPRHIDINDNDRNVFGQTTLKPSPRRTFTTLREDEEENQSFIAGFAHGTKRQSPTDIFSTSKKPDSRRGSQHYPSGREEDELADSDDEKHSHRHTKPNDQSQSRRSSHRSRDESDLSDDDHHSEDRADLSRPRHSTHDVAQVLGNDAELTTAAHRPSASRPGSGNKTDAAPVRRSSVCDEPDAIIPTAANPQSQSRPTSAKSTTSRHQTKSAIDHISSANLPTNDDPLTSNNEALAAALRPPTPPPPAIVPMATIELPPRPKSSTLPRASSSGPRDKRKAKPKVPSRYREITSRVDCGRTPVSALDLQKSIEREFQKELKSQTLVRPQSVRARKQSASSNQDGRQRPRSTSAYDHVKPRVNTNLSINFDELDTSRTQADSSQSIKDGVYLEWVKAKETQKKLEKEELKQLKEEKVKKIDKLTIERRVQQVTSNLERWRQEKDEQIRKKRREELELQRKVEEEERNKKKAKQQDATAGFEDWKTKSLVDLKSKMEKEQAMKVEIERQQEEKQKHILEAEARYQKWMEKKTKQMKKKDQAKETVRGDQLKQVRENEETRFVSAQEAYEKWLQEKENKEMQKEREGRRRSSISGQQQQEERKVPFLPGGSQKNKGHVPHVVW